MSSRRINSLPYSRLVIPRPTHTPNYRNLHSSPKTMVKDKAAVIQEFNELVNMEADELKQWLTEEASLHAGWPKHDGSGETIGHDRYDLVNENLQSEVNLFPNSGRHIVEILSKNPHKDPDRYDEEDIAHMRKVVSYCKRHLAQEERAKQNPHSKSAKSLKNWGHDPQKEGLD
ncbi:hypothetical protein BDZ91DRAFT_792357 [Kalaharituber pfeilii]|nr:hypothetical protein BDZ91DRAFT_792357 [Kalaharituber pfeilii]